MSLVCLRRRCVLLGAVPVHSTYSLTHWCYTSLLLDPLVPFYHRVLSCLIFIEILRGLILLVVQEVIHPITICHLWMNIFKLAIIVVNVCLSKLFMFFNSGTNLIIMWHLQTTFYRNKRFYRLLTCWGTLAKRRRLLFINL